MRFLLALAALGYTLLPAGGQTPSTGTDTSPAATTDVTVPVSLSAGTAEVLRMAQSGVAEDVLLAYIQNAQTTFDLRADGIVYLKNQGVTSPVIKAILNQDVLLRAQPIAAPVAAPVPATVPGPQPIAEPTVAPAPMGPPTPVYDNNPPPEVASFYSELAPYGAWIQLSGVGWCWQPSVVVSQPGWRPYCHGGQWVWTDAGWYWQSDYSWGWAPFHYGRWLRHERSGWVWLSDTVWGPAWVTWRVAGDQCGWAPLPPRAEFDAAYGFRFNGVRVTASFDFGLRPEVFAFIALADFRRPDLAARLYPTADVVRLYHQSTVVNTYVVNHTIVNRGVAVERVVAATHQPVQRVAIRDLPAGAPRPANLRSAEGAEPIVYRPPLAAPAKHLAVVAQQVDDRHPVVNHSFAASAAARPPAHTPPSAAPPVPNALSRSAHGRTEPARPVEPNPEHSAVNGPSGSATRSAVEHNPSTAARSDPTPSAKPAAGGETSPSSTRPLPEGKLTPRGVEVYHREPGPAFVAPTPAKPATTPAPSPHSRPNVPKSSQPENESHPTPPPAIPGGK